MNRLRVATRGTIERAVIGETIGNFKVVKRLGTGGMGEVWLGEQLSIGTHVAIKILNASVSKDSEHVQRFFNEARAVSKIQHAGIVKIFDVGTHSGQAYLIMEYLEGETLGQRMKRGRLRFGEIGEIGKQIATVLDATHNAGITHRDLKPDNIFLVPDRELGERVKILDFGIAKLTGTLAGGSPQTMGTMGTPAYMAPEQWGDTSKVDWRADLYSLGCVAFEMATGRVPFTAMTVAEACGQHLNAEPPKVSSLAPTVPAALERLIAQLLEKEPGDRPASMQDVAAAFATVEKQALGSAPTVTTEPVSLPGRTMTTDDAKRSRALPLVLGVLVLGGGAAGAVYLMQERESSTSATSASDATEVVAATTSADAEIAQTPIAAAPSPTPAPAPATAADAATPVTPVTVSPADAAMPDAPAVKAKPDSKAPAVGKQKPETQGGADAEQLQQAVHARSAQTTACYEAALKDDPSLAGMVTLQIKIDANGRVTSATADGLNDDVQACIVAQVKSIKFPKPADPPVSLIVPFQFQRE